MSSFAIGVDLGGTNLRISAVDCSGNLLEKLTTATKVVLGRDFVIQEMCDAIQSMSFRLGDKGNLCGVGIGVPGIINKRTGTLRKSPNLPTGTTTRSKRKSNGGSMPPLSWRMTRMRLR